MVQPVKKLRNVHKRTKRFARHQSDRFDRLKPSWRRPKGPSPSILGLWCW
jgi:large subunit ribosomal protein L32e